MFDTSPNYGLSILRFVFVALRPVFTVLRPAFVVLWRVFEAVSIFMDNFTQIFGVLLLVGMWGLLLVNAIARWTGITPIGWSLEITAYMIAWSIFIMMGPITRSDDHIRVTFLPEKVLGEKRAASFMHALENLVGLCLCIYLSLHGYELVYGTFQDGKRVESSGGWWYPMWIVRSGIMLGFCFTALFYFERTVKWISRLFTGGEMIPSAGFMGSASMPSSIREEEESKPEPGTDTQSQAEISNAPNDKEISFEEQE